LLVSRQAIQEARDSLLENILSRANICTCIFPSLSYCSAFDERVWKFKYSLRPANICTRLFSRGKVPADATRLSCNFFSPFLPGSVREALWTCIARAITTQINYLCACASVSVERIPRGRVNVRPASITGQDFPRMFRNTLRGRDSTRSSETPSSLLADASPTENR